MSNEAEENKDNKDNKEKIRNPINFQRNITFALFPNGFDSWR